MQHKEMQRWKITQPECTKALSNRVIAARPAADGDRRMNGRAFPLIAAARTAADRYQGPPPVSRVLRTWHLAGVASAVPRSLDRDAHRCHELRRTGPYSYSSPRASGAHLTWYCLIISSVRSYCSCSCDCQAASTSSGSFPFSSNRCRSSLLTPSSPRTFTT
jgi:hypothetical protein